MSFLLGLGAVLCFLTWCIAPAPPRPAVPPPAVERIEAP
jgi:hypothetical protein